MSSVTATSEAEQCSRCGRTESPTCCATPPSRPPGRPPREVTAERYYVVFTSSFRGDSAPCISHETVDKERTLCGRKVSDAATFEPDSNNLEADCNICRKAAAKLKPALTRDATDEAQLRCHACIDGHKLGQLRKRCGASGCECWCNR